MRAYAKVMIVLVLLTGCHRAPPKPAKPSAEDKARTIIGPTLIDPTSFLLRQVREVSDPKGVKGICGEVNAKNRFGGYVGFTQFVIDESDNTVIQAPTEGWNATWPEYYWRFCPTPSERVEHDKSEREAEQDNAKFAADKAASDSVIQSVTGKWEAVPGSYGQPFTISDQFVLAGYSIFTIKKAKKVDDYIAFEGSWVNPESPFGGDSFSFFITKDGNIKLFSGQIFHRTDAPDQ